MRVLVTWGSKLGGTTGIAEQIADVLRREGREVVALPAASVRSLAGVDAVIVGGALYGNRWHPDARRLVARHVRSLRRVPVWFFSSGPLDASADGGVLPPVPRVRALMERVGAQDHVTFGGRLERDVRGFPAQAMARTMSGDWRNRERIRAWAEDVGRALPSARPRAAVEPPGRSLAWLGAHAGLAAIACTALLLALASIMSARATLIVHAIVAPLVVAPIAARYFRPRGARTALWVALVFAAVVGAAEAAVVADGMVRGVALAPLATRITAWLPLALVLLVTWGIGGVISTMPWPRRGVPSAPAPCADRPPPAAPSSSPAR